MEQHAVITPEMMERARSRIGKLFVPREPYYNAQATLVLPSRERNYWPLERRLKR